MNLEVFTGGVYGLLGPNGAGKTTVIRMLATLLPIDAGQALIWGVDVANNPGKIREFVGLTGQYASVDEDLTGLENLTLIAGLYGFAGRAARQRAEELLGTFGLMAAAKRQVKGYSGGMRRRLDIAASLVVTPRLLFLDEPTTGLDPRSRNQVWEIVRALVEADTTVVLTTQYLEEADQLADRIAVIDRGSVIAEGTPAELKASVGASSLHIRLKRAEDRPRAAEVLGGALGEVPVLDALATGLTVRADDQAAAGRAITGLAQAGIFTTAFNLGQPSLDEVFLTLTGASTEDPADAEDEGSPRP